MTMVSGRLKRVYEVIADQITVLQLQDEMYGISSYEKKDLEVLKEMQRFLQGKSEDNKPVINAANVSPFLTY